MSEKNSTTTNGMSPFARAVSDLVLVSTGAFIGHQKTQYPSRETVYGKRTLEYLGAEAKVVLPQQQE